MNGFSTKDLEALENEVLRLAKKYPKEVKTFLQKQGNKLKTKAKKLPGAAKVYGGRCLSILS